MKKLLFLMVVSLMLAGVASANTVWNPALGAYVDGDVAPWDEVPTLWANGTPVSYFSGVTGADGKAVFNLVDTAECLVANTAKWGTLVMGDNGAEEAHNAVLRIVDGGTLEITGDGDYSWVALGYSRDAGEIVVERGGLLDINSHLYIGMNEDTNPAGGVGVGIGRLVINGGTALVADTFRYGRRANTEGYVDLNSGLFEARYLNSSGPNGGLFDIKFGKYRLTGGENSDRDRLQRDIDDGYCVCWGGTGTPILAEEANEDWFIVCDPADDPLLRVPSMDRYAKTNATLPLSWLNLDSIPSGGNVWVDVYFGTDATYDPNTATYADFNKVVDATTFPGLNATGATVPAPIDLQEYIWRVDTYRDGDPAIVGNYTPFPDDGDPNTSEDPLYEVDAGMQMYFIALSDFPVDDVTFDTVPMITWKTEPIDLQATVYDDGVSPVTVTWSTDEADPNETWTNPVTVIPIGPDYSFTGVIVTASIAIDYHASQFVVTVEANDTSPIAVPVTDTVGHDCADSACQATDVLGLAHDADVVLDCVIDLLDAARLAVDWVNHYAIPGPTPLP